MSELATGGMLCICRMPKFWRGVWCEAMLKAPTMPQAGDAVGSKARIFPSPASY